MLLYFVIALALLIGLELSYFFIARRLGIVDRPNERSSHHRLTLRGGGIIFFLSLVVYAVFHWSSLDGEMWRLLASATLLAVVCFADDVRGLPSWLRMLVQIATVLISFYAFVAGVETWKILVVVIVFVGILNVYNFMDGLNGMLALYSIVVVGTLAAANQFEFHFVDDAFIYTVLLGLVVFAFFNCRKRARCFSGDVGSVVMGLIIIYLLVLYVKGQLYGGTAVSVLTFIIVFLADGLLTITKRFLTGKNIFEPHREHLYETIANELHVPHLRVSIFYAVLQLLINIGYFLVSDRNMYALLCVLVLTMGYGLFFFFFNRHQEKIEG